MTVGWMRGLACCLCVGCGFSASTSSMTPLDADPIDAPDAPPPKPYWVVVGLSRVNVPRLQILPFDGVEFTTPCAEQASTSAGYAIRELVPHPTLNKLYAVDDGFRIINPACGGSTFAGPTALSGPREIQQIVLDPATGIGFFTMDGAGATGVYRFTTAADGTPTVNGMANAISNAGPLAFDPATAAIFIAAPGFTRVDHYDLVTPGFTFPGTAADNALGCMEPRRLVVTGNNLLLEYCGDTAEVKRIVRSPFAADPMTGQSLGAVDQVVVLPNDRVVAARKAPNLDLVVVSNNNGVPFWGTSVPIASGIIAMGVSKDARLVATARVTGPDSSEVAVWDLTGDTLKLVAVTPVSALVTAIGVLAPGS